MDATTLTCFRLNAPEKVCTVELLGSWDNFAVPYRLRRDFSRGRGVWVGCHSFQNIIFDGDSQVWTKPRHGGLKQGGRYWYYYRMDDTEEYCDPNQPTSSECPLLPGQRLNFLEVPVEIEITTCHGYSFSADLAPMKKPSMTYNPDDRYKKILRQPLGILGRFYSSTEDLVTKALPAVPAPCAQVSDHKEVNSDSTPFQQLVRRVKSFNRPRGPPGSSPRKEMQLPASPVSLLSVGSISPQASQNTSPKVSPLPAYASPARPPTRSRDDEDPMHDYFTLESRSEGLGITVADARTSSMASQHAHNVERPQAPPRTASSHAAPCWEGLDFGFSQKTAMCTSPQSDTGIDISSPTFTDETIETPGSGTPHRLSGHFVIEVASPLHFNTSITEDMEISDVGRRLSRLTTTHLDESDQDTIHLSPYVAGSPPRFAIPSNKTSPAMSLNKPNATTPSPPMALQRPHLTPKDVVRSSPLANDIFGELGFLKDIIN